MAIKSTGLLTKGIRSEFMNRYKATAALYTALATRIKSNSDSESYRWLGSVPQMREFGNGRLAKGLRSESYDVRNLKYEATLEVDRDEVSDDQTGQIRVRINELAMKAKTHPDFLMAQLLMNGATQGFNAYDGKPFFSELHESGNSGVQVNIIESAMAGDVPTSAEMKVAIQDAIAQLLGFKDDQGDPMSTDAGGIVVVVPPQHLFPAREALTATMLNNTSNVLVGVAPEPVVFPYLTDPAEFFVLKTNGAIRPFVFQDREPLEFNALDDDDSEEGFKREKYLYGVRARYRMTYAYWQFAVKVALGN
ncbi:MAG: Mu-like prophage major head subunit gpT family protein [Phycisphaerales bacterium]|nr:Mu-like prophage major head subunit gpT family protein [Phycisphaerales bacterium]MCB9855275.1 Mu-like prophage major head subunit gpT family protein [Phycisphaerales bacterium]MCB9862868.1 Mu-like prophage major head subunit gpT family protein [Phycisphaerales bacterium]